MKATIDNKPYDIPTNWGDVTYLNFAHSKTKGLSLETKLSYQTTVPADIISKLPLKDLQQLVGMVEFQDDDPVFFEFISELEVGDEHYIKMEQSRVALEQSENHWLAAIEIVKIYTRTDIEKTGTDISSLPVPQGYGYAVFFLNRLTGSLNATKG